MSFAINHPNGDHLGFALFVGGPERGDAIIRFMPSKAEYFDALEGKQLAELMDAGEFEWIRSPEGTSAQAKMGPCLFIIRGHQLFYSGSVFGLVPLKSGSGHS